MGRRHPEWFVPILVAAFACTFAGGPSAAVVDASSNKVEAGWALRVAVPEAIGGKTVIGQLTVDNADRPGFVTAYGCDDELPRNASGGVNRSDLNYDGRVGPVWSNRLIVEADDDGDVCFFTSEAVDMIIDLNGTSFDTGITSFPNRRTDTRSEPSGPLAAGGVLSVSVPEAAGRKTVLGQISVDRTATPGFVTAYPCDDGLPRNSLGEIIRSDLNFDGAVTPVWSNRLIVEADDEGDVCFYTSETAAVIVDVNGVSDAGIASFANRRTDSRARANGLLRSGGVLRVTVPEAAGQKTVLGQLSIDSAEMSGFVTAFGCDDGVPRDNAYDVIRSDLNFDGRVSPVSSNRLIVEADADGEVCFYTSQPVQIIVDVNGVSGAGISSFPNRRVDTRSGAQSVTAIPVSSGVPIWPRFEPRPALVGVAALTGAPTTAEIAQRPILAVKIDNYWRARPQFGLDEADAVIEENVEGVTRFVALFQTILPPVIGPVRSARTGDLDLLAGMNRPVFAYSGANAGVMAWLDSAESSGVLVDYSAQRRPCYFREPTRPGPHNLLMDPACAVARVDGEGAGAAQPLWSIDPSWTVPAGVDSSPDTTFLVKMDGVRVEWTWDASTKRYVRSQDHAPHLAASDRQIAASNVVEVFSVHVPSPVDARSPNPITVGAGTAVVHRNGRAFPATWSRPGPTDPIMFSDARTGAAIPLDIGRTFIELVRAS